MMELLAGALVTLAVLSYVLEPLIAQGSPPDPDPATIERMRSRRVSACPSCGTSGDPASAFCPRCGAPLAS